MCKVLSYDSVQKNHNDAWSALPEPYKADSCLTFYQHENRLYAEYDQGGTFRFSSGTGKWQAMRD